MLHSYIVNRLFTWTLGLANVFKIDPHKNFCLQYILGIIDINKINNQF